MGPAREKVRVAHALEHLHLVADRRHGLEERRAFFDRHIKYIGDAFVLERNFQRLAVVARAHADVALDVDVGQEVHLDLDHPVALAGLAAPALDVEREPARLVAARLGLGQAGEPVADRAEGAGIGGRVRARRAADRRLVDVEPLVAVLQPAAGLGRLGCQRGAGLTLGAGGVQGGCEHGGVSDELGR